MSVVFFGVALAVVVLGVYGISFLVGVQNDFF
jgi:hypothetical protein